MIELKQYKRLEYSSTDRITDKLDFRRCKRVRVSYRLVQAKMLRKSGFLSESGLEQLVRDAPLSDRIYFRDDKYRFRLYFEVAKPGGGLVRLILSVHFKGHGLCVIYAIHTPRL